MDSLREFRFIDTRKVIPAEHQQVLPWAEDVGQAFRSPPQTNSRKLHPLIGLCKWNQVLQSPWSFHGIAWRVLVCHEISASRRGRRQILSQIAEVHRSQRGLSESECGIKDWVGSSIAQKSLKTPLSFEAFCLYKQLHSTCSVPNCFHGGSFVNTYIYMYRT